MSNHPNKRKNALQKKISLEQLAISERFQEDHSLTFDRITLDLSAKANTIHEIMDHLYQVYQKDITYYAVRQVILGYADRIAEINFRFDLMAYHRIRLIEIDETFKGRRVSFLVVVDADTGYILYLHWLAKRTKEDILALLMPQQELFQNVQVVLTDGAKYYPDVIKILCPQAIHQTCLIHVIRHLFPFLQPFESQYIKACHHTTQCREELKNTINQHESRITQIKDFKQQIRYWEGERRKYITDHHLKARSRGLKEEHPRIKKIAERLNEVHTKYRSMSKTDDQYKERLKHKNQAVTFAKNRQDVIWNQYMDQLHILYRFYGLFHQDSTSFEEKRLHFLQSLEKRKSQLLAKEIIRILTETSNLDSIFTEHCPIKLTRQYINTNVIESANSRIRPLLDKLRNWKDTEFSKAILELLRLRLNVSPPYNGPRKKSAPIERYGYKLRSRSWIDIIFDGLPPGPQSYNFLSFSKYDRPISALQLQCNKT